MASYIGSTPADSINYKSLQVQHFSTSSTATYTLDKSVSGANSIALFINNVRQQPGSSYAYTVSATTLTLSEAITSSDTMWCLYLEDTQTTDTVQSGNIAADAVDGTKLADNAIDSEHITADAVDGTKLADDAINSEHITDASIDNAHLGTDIDASKIATGTFANARISQASVTQHVTATDLSGVNADITALALREATNESSAAFNLPNKFIETFTDDTNLGTQTDGDRSAGYWATVFTTVPSSTIKLANNGGLYTGVADMLPTNNTNFTTEAWGYLTSGFTSHENHMFTNNVDGYAINYGVDGGTANLRRLQGNGSWQVYGNFTATIAHSNWYHFAYTKTASGVSYFFNGVRYEENQTATYTWSGNNFYLGRGVSASSHNWEGYVTEWRVSDVARYSGSTYTVPTAPFTTDGNTLLLLHSDTTDGSTTYTDSSGNAETITSSSGSIQHSTDVVSPLSSSVSSATGTLIQSANAVGSNKTKVAGTMLYKDNSGTASLGTDLKIYFTCNGGTNWTEAASYNAITPVYSSGIKQVRLGETTCTQGTDIRYKAVWANQASGSKETQLHGIGTNY